MKNLDFFLKNHEKFGSIRYGPRVQYYMEGGDCPPLDIYDNCASTIAVRQLRRDICGADYYGATTAAATTAARQLRLKLLECR